MILGVELQWGSVLVGGVVMFLLAAFQVLVGLRVIHFKGRTHMKVHKWGAWVLVGAGAGHGLVAATVYFGWKILS
ncbi:MAG: hypothetical protein Q8K99_14050 [Actinomycetota bacterium]|nr:hypothetical protein [Actinomycetota bacterium]